VGGLYYLDHRCSVPGNGRSDSSDAAFCCAAANPDNRFQGLVMLRFVALLALLVPAPFAAHAQDANVIDQVVGTFHNVTAGW
jgi:hypothetical protein